MTLDISAVMAGVDVRVPIHWEVIMQGTPIMGAMEDKTTKPEKPAKKLIIKASPIMGAVEVTN